MRTCFAVSVLAIMGIAAAPRAARAQDDESLMPEQSAAKAKELLQQTITALGGDAYLNVRDYVCTGHAAAFEHSGEAGEPSEFKDLWLMPDKERTEFEVKSIPLVAILIGQPPQKGGVNIQLFAGNQGWSMDRSGVNEQSPEAIADFQEQLRNSMNNVLRHRLSEDGMMFRYAGVDIVDLKPVDWVELVDSTNLTMRLAIEQSTHLPLQFVVTTRDPETHEETSRTTMYSEFLPSNGVMMPRNIMRMHNTMTASQVFYTECDVNTGLDPNLFTKQSLEERYAKLGNKDKPNKNKTQPGAPGSSP
jgi:hypothetical protein